MGSICYRPARFALLNRDIQLAAFASKFAMCLVKDGSSFMDEHPSVMADFTDLNEPSSAEYVRTQLSLSVTVDESKDNVYIPTTLLTAEFDIDVEDDPIAGAILYWIVGSGFGDDNDNIPMYGYELRHRVRGPETFEFPMPEDGLASLPNFGEKAYLIGRKNLLEGYKQYTTGFEMSLFMEGSNFLTATNPLVIGDLTSEFNGSGYAREATTFTLTEDATRDRIVIATANKDFGSLGNGSAKIAGGVFSIPGSVNGVSNTLAYAIRLPQPVDPGGENFTFQFSADGVAFL